MTETVHFYDNAALLERLSVGLRKRDQAVVFLVGAPLSEPANLGSPGVPGVDGVIQLIRREFSDEQSQLSALDKELAEAGDNRYQAAFKFLQGRRGQTTANEIVRNAVLAARNPGAPTLVSSDLEPGSVLEEACRNLEFDSQGWAISPATEALGKLVAGYPDRFGRSLLTTNFDPLIELAISRAGGSYYKTTLHADGYLGQTEAPGCHVVHLHGYWYGSDTLHTSRQLGHPRPKLKSSLNSLLRSKLTVVCAYGGWDDCFTDALMEVVRDDTAYPEILWTFFSPSPCPGEALLNRLQPGVDRGRVAFYAGVDCHRFFPALYQLWSTLQSPRIASPPPQAGAVWVTDRLRKEFEARNDARPLVLEGDEEDRPPLVEICVGRECELSNLAVSDAKVVFLTGMGGEGKSTIAARYYGDSQNQGRFAVYVWRDCKEESERFENQLAYLVEKLSEGKIAAKEFAKQNVGSVVQVLIGLIRSRAVLFVFDNADHYVDLEGERMTGSADMFIRAILVSETPSRVIFTCRPSVSYEHPQALSQRLQGLSLAATLRLFTERGAPFGGRRDRRSSPSHRWPRVLA